MIVVSILLAFGIDAWWAQRGARVQEVVAIRQIASDFDEHRQAIERGLADHHSRVRAASEALLRIGPEAVVSEEESLRLQDAYGTFDPVVFQPGMLETILNSGGLTLIQDPELRLALTRWSRRAEDLRIVQDYVIEESHALSTYLQGRVPERRGSRLGDLDLPPSSFPTNGTELFRQVEFENLVWRQAYASNAMASRLERLAQLADEVLRLASDR